jgi:hypothetical protein
MKQHIVGAIVLCLAIFVVTPWLPTVLVNLLVGNYVTVFILLAANLYLLRVNAILSVAFFLAVGSLFLENRKRKLATIETAKITTSIDGTTAAPVSALSVPAEDLIDGEVHPEHETPSTEEHGFEPTSEGQSNEFNKVGESIDEKHLIPTEDVRSASMEADKFIKGGLVV